MDVHQCARFQINPKKSHEQAIKRIVRYLLGTKTKGIIMKPTNNTNELTCYVDASFPGAFNSEDCEDPSSVYSLSGWIIKDSGCLISWERKIQTDIALITTEDEYIALSHASIDIIPMRSVSLEIETFISIPCSGLHLKCSMFEDNKGSEELAKVPKYRPRTKHFAIKYHHFRHSEQQGIMKINRIETTKQKADILTKPLPIQQHQYLRNKIMGWCCVLVQNPNNTNTYENIRFLTIGW